MQSYRITLKPLSPFATALKGDTLFGQLCWAVRHRLGNEFLQSCLEGYTDNQPFAVVSDAFPQGYWPLPKLPGVFYQKIEGEDRKAVKKRNWLPNAALQQPLENWLQLAKTDQDIATETGSLIEKHPQPHNSINRQTGTTGEGGFAPYSVEQEWYQPAILWDIFLLLDETRLSPEQLKTCLSDIGLFGYGKDASIGAGKFKMTAFETYRLPVQEKANACLTLAPSAPQGQGYDAAASYYQTFTRFGRHGDRAVHEQGKPFKNPILLAQTAAIFTIPIPEYGFIGQGLGGNGELSKTLAATVHQGYAPIIAVHFANKELS
jgi:CRISPR-associated protein Csm4